MCYTSATASTTVVRELLRTALTRPALSPTYNICITIRLRPMVYYRVGPATLGATVNDALSLQ